MFIRILIIYIMATMAFTLTTVAAPPPSEVQEKKDIAPVVVTGIVEDDTFIKTLSGSYKTPSQIRQFSLKISHVTRNNSNESINVDTPLQINYTYIPKWSEQQYAGPVRTDIAVGDHITIWLKKEGKYWTSILSGTTIEHHSFAKERVDFLKEPFLLKMERIGITLFLENQSIIVIFSLLGVLLSFSYRYVFR